MMRNVAITKGRYMIRGLSTTEAHRRQTVYGPNVFTVERTVSLFGNIMAMVGQPMFALLLVAACIYLVLGDLADGVALLLVVLAVLVLTFIQNQKSQNALKALRGMAQPFSMVMRNGLLQKVLAHEIVPGDLLSLMEGQQISADARLMQTHYLEVDESLVTGESLPITKRVGDKVLAGTYVIRGEGLARVIGTGLRSTMGQIGFSLQNFEKNTSPLQKQTARLINLLAKGVLVFCILMWIVQGWIHGHWMAGFLSAIVLAMSLLPEEYAIVLSMFPALGAKRLAEHGVLTTNTHAIETLGACSVICTDKTGTLTQNLMTPEIVLVETLMGIRPLTLKSALAHSPQALHALQVAILASSPRPFDAMETSLRDAVLFDAASYGEIVHTFALQAHLRVVGQAWRLPDQAKDSPLFLTAKGSPEDVMRLCQFTSKLTVAWMMQVEQMAEKGLRVIAVAECAQANPQAMHDLSDHRFEWLGLICFRDPIRDEIPAAVQACSQAGIRVVMITGDHPKTALAIAQQAGMFANTCVLGDALDAMSPKALTSCVRKHSVFARVSPLVKLKIVQALQADGQVVAMIGDGVNDVVALQAADVAVAMGMRGTDVAKRTAALILLNDNFSSLIRGIGLGRSIFTNMQKSMSYLLAVHLPIAGLAILPMLLNTPILLLPLHMACLELVIDPACSIVFENEPPNANAMRLPPRDVSGSVLGRTEIQIAVWRGVFAFFMVSLCYAYAWHLSDDLAFQRTMVFVTVVMGNVMLMTSYRQHLAHHWANPRMVLLSLSAGILTALAVYWPSAATVFKFVHLSLLDLIVALFFGAMTGLGRNFIQSKPVIF